MFVSQTASYKRRDDLPIDVAKCESVWLEIENFVPAISGKKTIIGTVYRSPSSSIKEFSVGLSETLDKIPRENKNAIILGDFNIDLLDNKNLAFVDFTGCFVGFGFESLINAPTWCSRQGSNSLIDNIISNLDMHPHTGILRVDITDRYPIFFYFDLPTSLPKSQLQWTKFNLSDYVELIERTDFFSVLCFSDAELALREFALVI